VYVHVLSSLERHEHRRGDFFDTDTGLFTDVGTRQGAENQLFSVLNHQIFTIMPPWQQGGYGGSAGAGGGGS
jgi:hypothetical protein